MVHRLRSSPHGFLGQAMIRLCCTAFRGHSLEESGPGQKGQVEIRLIRAHKKRRSFFDKNAKRTKTIAGLRAIRGPRG